MAQRQRAGLITPRSQDQNLLPVLFNSPALQKPVVKLDIKRSNQTFTGMAQRQRAGLITPRSLDRNGLPVFYNSYVLQKHAVNASDFKQKLNTLHRGGAEGARGAHNSEVVGSNPTSGIIQFASFTEAGCQAGH
jgi:hypothetical protein